MKLAVSRKLLCDSSSEKAEMGKPIFCSSSSLNSVEDVGAMMDVGILGALSS